MYERLSVKPKCKQTTLNLNEFILKLLSYNYFFQDKSKDSKANPLSVKNIGGVFVVLLCGLAVAIIVAILEFCWNSRKNSQIDHQSLCSEMAEELRFAMRCHGSRQKPALRRSCSRCSPENT